MFSKKRKNAVNIITLISVLGVAVGTLALVVVLSVFNGFESLIKEMYNPINADLVITPVYSKDFTVSSIDIDSLNKLAAWSSIKEVYEEKVLLRYDDREQIAKIRGVKQTPSEDSLAIEKYIFKGESFRPDSYWAIIGQSLAYNLSVSPGQFSKPLRVFIPNIDAKVNSISESAFIETSMYVSGIFSVQPNYDASYVITTLNEVQDFLSRPGRVSQIELNTFESNLKLVQEKLQVFLGSEFQVKNRYQQNEFLYKVLQTEKWAIFFILSFILFIATFNIVASVIMIVLEKRNDILSLRSLGATDLTLSKIFFYEGILIALVGSVLGLFFGVSLCLLQEKFGLISLGAEGNFIVNAYPVEVQSLDLFLIMITVMTIALFVTLIPVQILKRNFLN